MWYWSIPNIDIVNFIEGNTNLKNVYYFIYIHQLYIIYAYLMEPVTGFNVITLKSAYSIEFIMF